MLINSVSKFTNLSTQLPIYHVADGHMIQYRNTWSIDFLDFFIWKNGMPIVLREFLRSILKRSDK